MTFYMGNFKQTGTNSRAPNAIWIIALSLYHPEYHAHFVPMD